jgi:hypothetical protein
MEQNNCNNRENTDRESEENLLGVFSILLTVAKRTKIIIFGIIIM